MLFITSTDRANVLSETYRVVKFAGGCTWDTVIDNLNMMDAVYKATELTGSTRKTHKVHRVTTLARPELTDDEALVWPTREATKEQVTGEWTPHIPHFTDACLSRYHPNNGWVLPDTVKF